MCTVIHMNNHSHWRKPHLFIILLLWTPKWILLATVLCRWYTELCLKVKSLCNSLHFPPFIFLYLPALITDSFHPLSSRVYNITLSCLRSDANYARQTSVPVAPYTQLCLCSRPLRGRAPVWAPTLFSDLTWILTPATFAWDCPVKEPE